MKDDDDDDEDNNNNNDNLIIIMKLWNPRGSYVSCRKREYLCRGLYVRYRFRNSKAQNVKYERSMPMIIWAYLISRSSNLWLVSLLILNYYLADST
jgi:hypothetical protein